MMVELRLSLLVAAGVALLSPAPAAAQSPELEQVRRFVGEWDTSFGRARLWSGADGRTLSGRYGDDGGRFDQVRLEPGGGISGYWIEDDAAERQPTARRGSHCWGRFRFTVEGGRLRGAWSYGDAEPSAAWTGTRRDAFAVEAEARQAAPPWLDRTDARLVADWSRADEATYRTNRVRVVRRHGYVQRGERLLRVETDSVEQFAYTHQWGRVDYAWSEPTHPTLLTLESVLTSQYLTQVLQRINDYHEPNLAKESLRALAPFLGSGWDTADDAELLRRVSDVQDDAARLQAEVRAFRQRLGQAVATRYVAREHGRRVRGGWEVLRTLRREVPVDRVPAGTIRITARGEAYLGWPVMRVEVDGRVVGQVTVDGARARAFRFTLRGLTARRLTLQFVNDRYGGSRQRDRNLLVEAVVVDGRALPLREGRYLGRPARPVDGQVRMNHAGRLTFDLSVARGPERLRRGGRRVLEPEGSAARELLELVTRPQVGTDPFGRPLRSPRAQPADEAALRSAIERIAGRQPTVR